MNITFSNGHFYSASQFFKEKFGEKIYKISLDAGCTCPNRDGSKGYGGCIFCSQSGSGDFAASKNKSIEEQVEEGKRLVSSKIKGGKYIAYFQNFSNTYGAEEELIRKFETALNQKDVTGLAIGTRPDCVSNSILEKIARLSENHFVIMELGLQTSNEKTGILINRLYTNKDYSDCVRRIKNASLKIHVVTHLIFGLPGENYNDMLSSLDYAVQNGTDGVKISVLHVLKNTKLFEMYEKGLVKTFTQEEYFSVLGKAINRTPENIVFHRITGDGAKKILVSPMWTANKRQVLNDFSKYMVENEIVQGKDF